MEPDRGNPNYQALQENLNRLQQMKMDGDALEIVVLPTTRRMVREDLVLPASYANFYIANKVVLVPTYGEPNDDIALGILREHFPGRRMRDRLPGTDLGPGGVSLSDPATAGGVTRGCRGGLGNASLGGTGGWHNHLYNFLRRVRGAPTFALTSYQLNPGIGQIPPAFRAALPTGQAAGSRSRRRN